MLDVGSVLEETAGRDIEEPVVDSIGIHVLEVERRSAKRPPQEIFEN